MSAKVFWSDYSRLCMIFASLLLSFEPGLSLKQTFRLEPQDVEVVAGSEIVLPCEVNNQQGDAQWTRHGFALGFDRSVLGLSRYRMLGEASEGVHNLEIKNVTIEDDGEFQCQVTPFNNARHIRTMARVTVLLPPSGLTLEGKSGDSRVTVGAGNSLMLTCNVLDAKPAPAIVWKRNGVVINPESKTDTESDSDDGVRKSMRSRVTLTPSHDDNGANFTCEASHPALTEMGTRMAHTVNLDVHYPPGGPEISGYREVEIVRAGDRKVLTCRSRGGNPIPDIFWYKNGQLIDKKYNKHSSYAINEYEFTVEATDNKAKYECQVRNVMTSQPKKASIRLRVNFPPSEVIITAPDNARVGDVIGVSCVAKDSNPAADVSLVINGLTPPGIASSRRKGDNGGFTTTTNLTHYEIMPTDEDLTISCYAHNQPLTSTKVETKTVIVLRPPGAPVIIGYDGSRPLRKGDPQRLTCVSTGGNPLATLTWFKNDVEVSSTYKEEIGSAVADLDLFLEASDNEAVYRCEAENLALETPLSNSTVLNVQFPPDGVMVSINPEQVRSGHPATLSCESSTSYPLSNVTWWKGGEQLTGGQWEVKNGDYGGTVTLYSVTVDVEADDDGTVFTCEADNGLLPTTHDAITLSIQYKPVWEEEDNQPPSTIENSEGEVVALVASAHGKPSTITYTWRKDGEVIGSGKTLNLTTITRDQAGLYQVEATNSEGSTFRNVTVRVKYAPSITMISDRQTVGVKTTVDLECQADGLPKPTLSWSRDGYDFSKTEQITDETNSRSILTISSTDIDDTGKFVCEAKNEIGDTRGNATVIINHKPILDTSAIYQKAGAELGSTARLVCRARGSPFVSFSWFTKDNTPIEEKLYSLFNNRYAVDVPKLVDDLSTYESVLEIKEVSSSDHGFFECQASNSLGYTAGTVHLEGTGKPDPPTSLKVLNTTHNSVILKWTPGYDGGLEQTFRVRFHVEGALRYQYVDVHPSDSVQFILSGLSLATTYSFAVQSRNSKGESAFTQEDVKATTQKEPVGGLGDPPTGQVSSSTDHKSAWPGLVVAIVILIGSALLVINVVLIACFLRRKGSKRLNRPPRWADLSEVEKAITKVLEDKAALPKVVTLSVFPVVGVLVLINIVLFVCILKRRKQSQKGSQASASEKGSSKSTTLEMYAPSSYNGTVNGETLSSISEKSRESYAQENDSADEYDIDAARVAATSSYLIDQLEPPPEYAGGRRQGPLHIMSNPVSQQHNNLDYDQHRNQYNANLDRQGMNYGTLGRRQPMSQNSAHMMPDLYSPASEPGSGGNLHRYNTYNPHQHVMAGPIQQNNTIHRTQAPKLQFPKDYIRNGSMTAMNIPVSPQGGNGPASPTRGQPMLTTFSGDHTKPTTTLPIEQRGHLV